jgi:lipid II:glycine glycyltransferase (peptidoglycan interpeptide bridge formation enzyme)
MIDLEINQIPDKFWNKRLIETNTGTVYQTKEYAKYAKTILKWTPLFLSFHNANGDYLGQLLLFKYKYQNHKFVNLRNFFSTKKIIHRWFYGPVIFDSSYNIEIIDRLQEYLLKTNSKIHGSFHPLSENNFNLINPMKSNVWSTFLINLKQSEENILKKMNKHSAQKNIRRAKSRGVTIQTISENNIHHYHTLLSQTKEKSGITINTNDEKQLWDILKPIGFTGFLAMYKEKPIGGLLISTFNGYINEWGVARSDLDFKEKLYSQDLIKWEIISWGKKQNFSYYDLSGVNRNSEDKKEKGIFQYKKKWGGDLYDYDILTL